MASRERISVLDGNSAAGLSDCYQDKLAPQRVNLLLADLTAAFDKNSVDELKIEVDPKKMYAQYVAKGMILEKSFMDGGDAIKVMNDKKQPLLWKTLVPASPLPPKNSPRLSVECAPEMKAETGADT